MAAREPGARLLLLERGRFPRDKVCGDGLTYRAIPAVRERLVKVGVEPHPMSVAAFNEMIRKDAPRWAELVERSGAKAD